MSKKVQTRLYSCMVTTATTTATSCTYSAAAAAWGYLRLNPRPPAPIGALLHVASGTCGAKREPERGHERQSDHEKEAKRSRVRGLRGLLQLSICSPRRPAISRGRMLLKRWWRRSHFLASTVNFNPLRGARCSNSLDGRTPGARGRAPLPDMVRKLSTRRIHWSGCEDVDA